MNFTLEHAWGASEYIEEIVESVVELDKRGVLTALTTDAPILSVDALIHHAGEAVREGCDVERALRMITINAAKIMGVDDRIGSIEEGKDADIALFKGLPAFNTNAKVVHTIINGNVVFSASHF